MAARLQIFAPQKLWRAQVVERLGTPSLATDATTGFQYVPACAGTPTGTPNAIAGYTPIVVDSTNDLLYFFSNGAWHAA